MSAHPALRHFFAAAAGHPQHMSEAQAGFLAQGLHPALAASLAAAGHSAHTLPPHNGNNNHENGAPSFQSVLASLSAYRPRPSVSSPSTSPTSTPSSARPALSSSPDFSALLRMQQPNLPSQLAAAVARSLPSFVPPTQGGVSPPPSQQQQQQPPSPSTVAAAMAAVAAGRHAAASGNPAAAESLNALRLKAREHELRLEMIKKMES